MTNLLSFAQGGFLELWNSHFRIVLVGDGETLNLNLEESSFPRSRSGLSPRSSSWITPGTIEDGHIFSQKQFGIPNDRNSGQGCATNAQAHLLAPLQSRILCESMWPFVGDRSYMSGLQGGQRINRPSLF